MTIPLLADSPEALDALSRAEITYTDLDGTLLGLGGSLLIDGQARPSLGVAEAVVRLNTESLPVIAVTGRNRLQCNEITRLLGWRGYIAELGGVIVPDRGADPVFNTGDWPDGLLGEGETPYQLIERTGTISALMRAFPGRLEPHAPYHLNREATVVLRGSIDLDQARALLGNLDMPVEIIDNGIVRPLVTGLSEMSEIRAYHLLPPGVTKPGAITRDLARRELARDQASAIGDAVTDVTMADACSIGAVVANALADARVVEEARARHNVYSTAGERGDGWAEYARLWLDSKKR
jgi:hydroxymethylpyrimidine pyrophosphatase-like HAD family hydrolase